jgi:hypothetical protein
VKLRSSLAHDDLTGLDELTAETFHAETL